MAYTSGINGVNTHEMQAPQAPARPQEAEKPFAGELARQQQMAALPEEDTDHTVEEEQPLNSEGGEEESRTGALGEMDSEAFLQLLVTQMQHQDPMGEQQDPNEFITQVTILSVMEQVIQMQDALEEQSEYAEKNRLLGVLNREVELTDETGEQVSGTVTQVDLNSSEITVNGEEYPFSAVTRVGGGQ